MKKQKGLIVSGILLIVVGLLIVAGGLYVYKNKKTNALNSATNTSVLQTAQNVNWKTYSNSAGNYKISYPNDASVSFIDTGANPDKCVLIKHNFGFIEINTGASIPCSGSTGVGIGDNRVTENVFIGDKDFNVTYTAVGFVHKDNSSSFLNLQFANKIYVTYGVNAKKTLSDADYSSAMSDIKSILSTLKIIDGTSPKQWKKYSSVSYGFQLQYPAGGRYDEHSDTDVKEVLFQPSDFVNGLMTDPRALYVRVVPQSSCNDFDAGVKISHTNINGVDFTKGDVSKDWSSMNDPVTAIEYCTIKNNTSYKIISTISGGHDTLSDLDADGTLNKMINSFQFISGI